MIHTPPLLRGIRIVSLVMVGCSSSPDDATSTRPPIDGGTRTPPGLDGSSASTQTVTITPSSAHLAPSGTQLFSASVALAANQTDTSVGWSVQESAAGGSITASGLYTAPKNAGVYHVIATSHSAPSAMAMATVTVAAPGACPTLPQAGTWDAKDISPVSPTANESSSQFTGKSMAIVVDPFDSSIVWLGTGENGLFKSTNCGGTWNVVSTGMNGPDNIGKSSLWSMIVDPNNQGVIYTVTAYGVLGLWKSTNGGVDWTNLFPPDSAFAKNLVGDPNAQNNSFVNNVSMDAADSKHLLAMSHGTCAPTFKHGCIAETFDAGTTWNVVSLPADWSETSGVQIINATTWILGGGESFDGMYVTTNNGKTWTQPLTSREGDGEGELSILPVTKAVDGAYYLASLEGVLRSTDGVAWSLAWKQSGMIEGLAVGSSTIYGANDHTLYSAPISDPSNWSAMKNQPAIAPSGYAGFLAWDEAHHVLYVSCWGGVFRYVAP